MDNIFYCFWMHIFLFLFFLFFSSFFGILKLAFYGKSEKGEKGDMRHKRHTLVIIITSILVLKIIIRSAYIFHKYNDGSTEKNCLVVVVFLELLIYGVLMYQ